MTDWWKLSVRRGGEGAWLIESRKVIDVTPGGREYRRYAVDRREVMLRRERSLVCGVKRGGM